MTVCLGPEITKRKKVQGVYIILALYKNLKSLGGRAGKSAMADTTKTTAHEFHRTIVKVVWRSTW